MLDSSSAHKAYVLACCWSSIYMFSHFHFQGLLAAFLQSHHSRVGSVHISIGLERLYTENKQMSSLFFWENSVLSGCEGSGLRDGVTIQQSNNRRLISVWFQASVAQGSDRILVQQTCVCSALIFSPSPLTAFWITLAQSFKRAMTLFGTWSR